MSVEVANGWIHMLTHTLTKEDSLDGKVSILGLTDLFYPKKSTTLFLRKFK